MNNKPGRKILLVAVNAKYIHSNLAVYSLKAYCENLGQNVDLREFTINQQTQNILRDIYNEEPQMLCFSCYIWNKEYIKIISREFHKLCPQVPIWLGGPEVSYCAEKFLKENPQISGIIVGEGEETFYRLCKTFNEVADVSEIFGIAYRNAEGEICVNQGCNPVNMDDIPFCYNNLEQFENRIIYYESGRGCPFSCSYCLSSVDKNLRFRSLELVYKELQFFIDNKVKQVKFVDRTFNCNHKHAMGIWQYIYEHDNGVTNFHFEVSADLLREEEIELLAKLRPGLVQLEIGVQSVNEETIKEIHRTMKLDRLKETVRKVAEAGNVHQHLDLIAGLPFEDYNSFVNSFDEIYSLKPQQLQLGFLKVLKGSYMYEQAKNYDLIYQDMPPYEVMSTKWLSYEDILQIKLVEEMLEIHYNSGQFLRTLAVLEKCFDSPFDMYLKLAHYYIDNGMADKSYTRIGRSEILYRFAVSVDAVNKSLYEETLVFDLYIREKSKTKPTWTSRETVYDKELLGWLKSQGFDKKYCKVLEFEYPVNNICIGENHTKQQIEKLDEPQFVIFNYEKRNPIDNEAEVTVIKNGGKLCQ